MLNSPFQHCSHCGATPLHQRSEREFHCDECGHLHWITPVPAAGALILDEADRLLVIRRAHNPGEGLLGLPGGVVEPGESGEQAAARETFEEVGLRIPPEQLRYLASLNNDYLYQGFVWPTIDLFFVGQLASFPELNPEPTEVSEVLFLPLDQVPVKQFAFRSNAKAVEILAAQRAG